MADKQTWTRCMGGKWCRHQPGTCTASKEYRAATALATMPLLQSCPFCEKQPAVLPSLADKFNLPGAMSGIEQRVTCTTPECPIQNVPIVFSEWQKRH